MSERSVVFGAGQIGSLVAQQLVALGHEVTVVRRSGSAGKRGGVQTVVGDVSDRAFAEACAKGATRLIHCVTPPYHQWPALLGPVNAGVLHAAQTSGAPVVVLDNLYGYGRPSGPLTEASPVAPVSKKGALRAEVAERFLEAHRAGSARVAIARASDFYGPGVTLTAVFGERFVGRALAGKPVECFGDPALLHSYSYAPDVARGLVTLAVSDTAWGNVWHLPVAPAESTASVAERFGAALGKPLGTTLVPRLVLRAMGLFVPPVKELLEMMYQWEVPFVLDDAKFRAAFGGTATSLEAGVTATVEWMRARSRQAAA